MSSFNILYIVELLYRLFGSTDEATIQGGALSLIQNLEWVALGLSVLLLAAFIAFKLLAAEAEHEIHHHRQELEHETAHAAQAQQHVRNPRWDQALALANSSHEGDWRRAIIEADSMLDSLLTERGFIGEDVGTKLRTAPISHFATKDLAGEAHGVRNRIAHDGESFKITSRDTLAVMDKYRRVFEEFGYI